MKEIEGIDLGRQRNGAHFVFATDAYKRANDDPKVKEKVAAEVAALGKALENEDEKLQLTQKSLLTDEIVEQDRVRDLLYSSYKKNVKGYLGFPVDEIAEAAKILWQHILDYRIKTNMQLDLETGMMMNFIKDLEGPFAAQVTTLAQTPIVAHMKVANDKVHTATVNRTEERMTRTLNAMREARRATDEAYKQLVKKVNALAVIEGDTDYAAFIDFMNEEIAHYKDIAKQKATPNEDEEKK